MKYFRLYMASILLMFSPYSKSQGEQSYYDPSEELDARLEKALMFSRRDPLQFDSTSVQVLESALRDSNDHVILYYLYAIRQAGTFGNVGDAPSDGSGFHLSEELKDLLANLITGENSEVSANASLAYLLASRKTVELESLIFENLIADGSLLDGTVSSGTYFPLIINMARGSVTEEFERWLLEALSDESGSVAEAAAMALSQSGSGDYPQDLPRRLISLAEREDNYANPNILEIILSDIAVNDVAPYKEELEAMQNTVSEQLALPLEERTVSMANAEFSLSLLNRILSRV